MTRLPDDQIFPGHPVIRLSGHLAILAGWKRNAIAFFLGICATLTLAPFFIFPLLIPAFSGLFLLISAAPTRKRVFWDGWWWGWGFYISGLYWFCIALLTDAEHFAWLIPFALFGLTGVIAIYSGLACWITAMLSSPLEGEQTRTSPKGAGRVVGGGCPTNDEPPPTLRASSPVETCAQPLPLKGGAKNIFVFSLVWTWVEYARGHLFTGFPWNLVGYSFGFSDVSLQPASLVGVYGVTFFAVLLGTSFAAIFPTSNQQPATSNIIFLTIIWSLFIIGIGWGTWRLHEADLIPESERYVPGIMLRLVQADISQPHKWDPRLQRKGLREQVRLTELPGLEKITHIIWPETAVPYAIEPGSPLAQQLGARIPEGKILITGALRMEGGEKDFQIWNSLMAIDHSGDIVGSYDKSKLVPFGEFLPFRSLIPKAWLTPVGDRDFSRGTGAQTLEWPGLPPLSPLICYEVIFPESVTDPNHHPQLLLNVTNDAWFGMSLGPYQHFEMARMRAVEQGVPLVRVANTGITAIVDSYGRIIAELPLGTKGILDHDLPKAQNTYTTYGNNDDIIFQSLLFLAVLLIIYKRRRRKH